MIIYYSVIQKEINEFRNLLFISLKTPQSVHKSPVTKIYASFFSILIFISHSMSSDLESCSHALLKHALRVQLTRNQIKNSTPLFVTIEKLKHNTSFKKRITSFIYSFIYLFVLLIVVVLVVFRLF